MNKACLITIEEGTEACAKYTFNAWRRDSSRWKVYFIRAGEKKRRCLTYMITNTNYNHNGILLKRQGIRESHLLCNQYRTLIWLQICHCMCSIYMCVYLHMFETIHVCQNLDTINDCITPHTIIAFKG